MTKEILLTEESIGKTFDLFYRNRKDGTFTLAFKNKNGMWQGYFNIDNYVNYKQFNDYGVEIQKLYTLKPQQEKINLWEWAKKQGNVINLRIHEEFIEIIICKESIAIIPVSRLQEPEPYFYEGEGL